MAMILCAECGSKISSTAKTCPQCGAKNSRRSWGLGTKLIAGFFVLLVIGYVQHALQRNQDPTAAAREDKANEQLLRFEALKSACKEAVSARLKAPASSDYPDPIEIRANKNDPNAFFVLGAVDAQNSFGAKLRQKYICELKAGPQWSANTVTRVTVGQ